MLRYCGPCRLVGDRNIRSESVSSNPWTMSNVVNEIENATGPLSQLSETPLNNPRSPCSLKTSRIVDTMLIVSVDADAACPKPRDPTAASLPDATPMVCMRLLVTSSGYVRVCAKRPEIPPHCIFSIVVGSWPVKFCIRRFACSLRVKAIPAYGNMPSSVGVIPRYKPMTP